MWNRHQWFGVFIHHFDLHGIAYSHICGKIIGYQDSSPDAFGHVHIHQQSIDGAYVDDISLTHGSNPRQHIWTKAFAATLDEVGSRPLYNCPCFNRNLASSATPPPDFVGNDYFCDTGSAEHFQHIFYGDIDDPLWDGAGCDQITTAVTSTILHGFTSNCLPPRLIISRCVFML